MAKYTAIGNRIIGKLVKKKDKSNGEHIQENGLVLVGTDPNKKNKEFDKNIAIVESVSSEIDNYYIKVGDRVHVAHMSGDVIDQYETDDEEIQIRSFTKEHILAIINE